MRIFRERENFFASVCSGILSSRDKSPPPYHKLSRHGNVPQTMQIQSINARIRNKANITLASQKQSASCGCRCIGLIKLGQGPIGGLLAERLPSSDDARPFGDYVDFSVRGAGDADVCANRQHPERQLQYYGPGKRVQAASVQTGTAGTMACTEI